MSFEETHIGGIKQCKCMGNLDGFSLQNSVFWVGNTLTSEQHPVGCWGTFLFGWKKMGGLGKNEERLCMDTPTYER